MCTGKNATPGGVELEVKANPCPINHGSSALINHSLEITNRANYQMSQVEIFVDATNDMLEVVAPARSRQRTKIRKVGQYYSIPQGNNVVRSCSLKQTTNASKGSDEEVMTTIAFDPTAQRQQPITLITRYLLRIQ